MKIKLSKKIQLVDFHYRNCQKMTLKYLNLINKSDFKKGLFGQDNQTACQMVWYSKCQKIKFRCLICKPAKVLLKYDQRRVIESQ